MSACTSCKSVSTPTFHSFWTANSRYGTQSWPKNRCESKCVARMFRKAARSICSAKFTTSWPTKRSKWKSWFGTEKPDRINKIERIQSRVRGLCRVLLSIFQKRDHWCGSEFLAAAQKFELDQEDCLDQLATHFFD